MDMDIKINIAGKEVKLSDLQSDVDYARQRLYSEHSFAFTCATVQGLIDKIQELEKLRLGNTEEQS